VRFLTGTDDNALMNVAPARAAGVDTAEGGVADVFGGLRGEDFGGWRCGSLARTW
jgi:methionyl-tRNA synthetase